jgi:hypothetical protein
MCIPSSSECWDEDKECGVEKPKTKVTETSDWRTVEKEFRCMGCIVDHPSQKYHMVTDENKFGCI